MELRSLLAIWCRVLVLQVATMAMSLRLQKWDFSSFPNFTSIGTYDDLMEGSGERTLRGADVSAGTEWETSGAGPDDEDGDAFGGSGAEPADEVDDAEYVPVVDISSIYATNTTVGKTFSFGGNMVIQEMERRPGVDGVALEDTDIALSTPLTVNKQQQNLPFKISFLKAGALIAAIGGVVIGFLTVILFMKFFVNRMRKKDQGNTTLDEQPPQHSRTHPKAPVKEL